MQFTGDQPLERFMLAMASNDNNVIREANDNISNFLLNPNMLEVVRQLSAILLRRQLETTQCWQAIPDDLTVQANKTSVKKLILELIRTEPEIVVRRSIAGVISSVAKLELSSIRDISQLEVHSSKWVELFSFLEEYCSNSDTKNKEIGFLLLSSLCDLVPYSMINYAQNIMNFFISEIQNHTNDKIVEYSIKGLFCLLHSLNLDDASHVELLRLSLPVLLQEVNRSIIAKDGSLVDFIFECFTEFFNERVEIMDIYVKECVEKGSAILLNQIDQLQNCEMNDLKSAVLTLYGSIAINSPKVLVNDASLFQKVILDPIEVLFDPRNRENGMVPDSLGKEIASTVNKIVLHLPAKECFTAIYNRIGGYLLQSNDSFLKGMSFFIIGVIAEGCGSAMNDYLIDILKTVNSVVDSKDDFLIEKAGLCLGQLCEYLQDKIFQYYNNLVVIITKLLMKDTDSAKFSGIYILQCLCEGIPKEQFKPNLTNFLIALFNILKTNYTKLYNNEHVNLKLLTSVLSGFTSLAANIQSDLQTNMFSPDDPDFSLIKLVTICKELMKIKTEEYYPLRAYSTECLCTIYVDVVRDEEQLISSGEYDSFLKLCLDNLKVEDDELAEYTLTSLGSLVAVHTPSNAVVNEVISYIFRVLETTQKSCQITTLSANEEFGKFGDPVVANESSNLNKFTFKVSSLDLTAAAVETLGIYASCIQTQFAPYINKSLEILIKLTDYFYPDIKRKALSSLKEVVLNANHCASDETIIKKLASTVVGIYIDIINNSTDKDCVMHAMEGIGEFVCEFDLSVFDLDSFKLLITSLLSLLYERSPCQKLEFENREYDGILFDPLAGLIATLANANSGKDPSEYSDVEKCLNEAIDTLLPGIDNHLKSNDETTVAWVMGCYCQLSRDNPSFTTKYADKLLDTYLQGFLNSSSDSISRNAVYGIGLLYEEGIKIDSEKTKKIIEKSYEIFASSPERNAFTDNIVAAFGRMLDSDYVEENIKEELLNRILVNIPLMYDMSENEDIYNKVCMICCNISSSNNLSLSGIYPHLIREIAIGLKVSTLSDETRELMEAELRTFKTKFPQQYSELVNITNLNMNSPTFVNN